MVLFLFACGGGGGIGGNSVNTSNSNTPSVNNDIVSDSNNSPDYQGQNQRATNPVAQPDAFIQGTTIGNWPGPETGVFETGFMPNPGVLYPVSGPFSITHDYCKLGSFFYYKREGYLHCGDIGRVWTECPIGCINGACIAPDIVVKNPITGNYWTKGNEYPIEWDSSFGYVSSDVFISLSFFYNGTMQRAGIANVSNSGSYMWKVWGGIKGVDLTKAYCKIEIKGKDFSGADVLGVSPVFYIVNLPSN